MAKKDTIGLLSMRNWWKETENESYERIPEEIENLGYKSQTLFFDKFFVSFQEGVNIYYDEKPLDLNRFKIFILIMGDDFDNSFIVNVIESQGLKVVNNLEAILTAKNKARTTLALTQAGLPTVPAAMNFSEFQLSPLMDFFPEDEYICKVIRGSAGKGVSYISSRLSLITLMEMLGANQGVKPTQLIFEKFIKEAAGKDKRLFVVGGKVVAAMERQSNGFDFRSNISGSGQAKAIRPSRELKDLASKAIEAVGLEYGGVDIMETGEGPVIVEVNSNPGLKIEQVTGVNVVGEIVEHILKFK